MLYYPQLSTGAMAQYPLRRSTVTRTVMNSLADGSTIRVADPDARANRWELRYSGLSDAERSALEQFFRDTEGPLRDFEFLDPEGNLLRWSEDPAQPVWRVDGLVSVSTAEGAWQVCNRGQLAQGIEQAIDAPGWYRYSFSVKVWSAVATPIRLMLANTDGALVADWMSGPDWRRIWCSGSIAGITEEIRCRIEIGAGASVQMRGVQLQAQPMPCCYRSTGAQHGVYAARFAQDRLEFRADGVDDHSTSVQIISKPGA